jgi:hypothetical protein
MRVCRAVRPTLHPRQTPKFIRLSALIGWGASRALSFERIWLASCEWSQMPQYLYE